MNCRFRRPLCVAIAMMLTLALPACGTNRIKSLSATSDRPFDSVLADLHERAFRFFWETANPNNGLVPDRYPTPSFASIAAVGYALTAYPVGVEHAYITREAARERVLTTLRFLYAAPQGPQTRGTAGYKGFFYHFLDLNTGERFGNVELSPADTALFLAGALFCQSYFNRKNTEEVEIRALVNALYSRVDWRWMQPRAPAIVVGWKPESGFIADDYHGYSEVMIMYLLALGSPSFAVGPEAWGEWTSTYERTWGHYFGQTYLHFPPLFGHQFTHVWVDFRNIQDDYMRAHGIDYFENSRRATYAQRAYAIDNPLGCKDYGESVWGITASDGPANVTVQQRVYRSYAARGIGGASAYDDCTLAPTAVAGSIPFAPEITIPTLLQMHRRYGQRIYSRYGFLDSFNPSFDYDLPLRHGRRIPGFGWVDNDYLGVDQGPILAMLENYHTELIWRVMRKNPYLRRGLERAGFSGGWLADAQRRLESRPASGGSPVPRGVVAGCTRGIQARSGARSQAHLRSSITGGWCGLGGSAGHPGPQERPHHDHYSAPEIGNLVAAVNRIADSRGMHARTILRLVA